VEDFPLRDLFRLGELSSQRTFLSEFSFVSEGFPLGVCSYVLDNFRLDELSSQRSLSSRRTFLSEFSFVSEDFPLGVLLRLGEHSSRRTFLSEFSFVSENCLRELPSLKTSVPENFCLGAVPSRRISIPKNYCPFEKLHRLFGPRARRGQTILARNAAWLLTTRLRLGVARGEKTTSATSSPPGESEPRSAALFGGAFWRRLPPAAPRRFGIFGLTRNPIRQGHLSKELLLSECKLKTRCQRCLSTL